MPKNYSPLRYPGGKSSLINFLGDIVTSNSPIDTYIEPFAGGAGAALGLLFEGKVSKIILNEADEFIFNFWDSILNDCSNLIKRITETSVTIDDYNNIKALYHNKQLIDIEKVDLGFASFYLNRCNRSGILGSGPIGGYDQHGKWKIDARYNKKDLISRIEKIYRYRDQIKFYNEDAISFLRNTIPSFTMDLNRILVYLDPPYYEQGSKLYRIYFNEEQHIELKKYLMNEYNLKWILSYDDVPFIKKLYEESSINGYQKNHFAYKAKIGKELIIFSDNCISPFGYERK